MTRDDFVKDLDECRNRKPKYFKNDVCGVQYKIGMFGDFEGANVHVYNQVGKDNRIVPVKLNTETGYICAFWGDELIEVPYCLDNNEKVNTYWETQYYGLR